MTKALRMPVGLSTLRRSLSAFARIACAAVVLVVALATPAAAEVDPSAVAFDLAVGESASVDKTVSIAADPLLADVCLVLDRSHSFERDLATLRANIPTLLDEIAGTDIRFGLAAFADYPQRPFGFSDDSAYELLAPLGDRASFTLALDGLTLGRGADPSEAQLDAIVAATGPGPADCGWRPLPSNRVLVATTDSLCHGPDGVHQASADDAAAAMVAESVTFIGLFESSDALECFAPLAAATGGATRAITSDAADIGRIVNEALGQSAFSITPALDPDCTGLGVAFEPPVLTDARPGTSFELVETITLTTATSADPINCAVDFGSAGVQTITVNPILPPTPATPTPTTTTPTPTPTPTGTSVPAAPATATPLAPAPTTPTSTPTAVVPSPTATVEVLAATALPVSAPAPTAPTAAPVVAASPTPTAAPVLVPTVAPAPVSDAKVLPKPPATPKPKGPALSVTGTDSLLLLQIALALVGAGSVMMGLRLRMQPVRPVPAPASAPGVRARRSTKLISMFLVAALFATALYASDNSPVAAEPVIGGQLFSTGGVVQIEVLPATAGITSQLYLFEPGPEQLLATNRDVGTIVEVGPFARGTELIFGIRAAGNEFRLGPADRNPDGVVHGQVDFIEPGVAIVGFEDLFGGGDLDYDDNVFRFTGELAAEPPQEPIPDPVPLPVVDAGPDQTVVEGDVVSLVASEPVGPGVGAQSIVQSIDRRTLPNDPDTSIEVELTGLTDGVIDGSVKLTSFGGEPFDLVNVIDLSGSTEFNVAGCGDDENADGRSSSILDCEVLAIVELNDRLATTPNAMTALVAFARDSVVGDLGPADGLQAFTSPTADADGDGVVDLEQVVRSVDVERIRLFTDSRLRGGTNFGAAVSSVCDIAVGRGTRTVVAFMSDGEPFRSSALNLPCGDVVFETFAVGGGAACEGRGTPSLQQIADLSGGSCIEIADVAELPEVFSLAIAPQVVAARLIIDDGVPIDVTSSVRPVLPSSGDMTMVFDTQDLLVGASEVCLEVDIRDALGVTPVSTCSALRQSDGTYSYQWRTVEQSGPSVLLVGANTPTPSFVAFDDGRYVFEVLATDNVGQTVSDTVTVVVNNSEPVVTISSFNPSVGGVALVSGEFADAGWDDLHEVQVDWGDGSVTAGVVGVQSSGQGTVFGTHVYEAPGAYDVSVSVVDDDGGVGTESVAAPPMVTSPAAVWANSAVDPAGGSALLFSGSNTALDGLVHSNASTAVTSCTNSFNGTVRYVTALDTDPFCGSPTDALALPVQAGPIASPLLLDIADFRPTGGVPAVIPGEYFDKTDRCRDGRWRVHDQDLSPGVYFADCDVDFINASGEVTIVATGEIRTSGEGLDFQPFFGSLLFLSGAAASAGVSVASTNSRYTGAVYALEGDVVLDGTGNSYVCGVYGDTVAFTGDDVMVAGADCGDRPDGSLAAVFQPQIELSIDTAADVVTPGDVAPFQLSLTHTGATFVVPGLAGLQNIDGQPVTVDGVTVTVETRSAGSAEWAAPADLNPVDLAIAATSAPGVDLGADGIVGTTIEPNAIAVWGFQAVAELAPETIARLIDPAQTAGMRLRVRFDTAPGQRVRPLYEIGADFIASVQAQTAATTSIEGTFLSSNGITQPIVLSDLVAGGTVTEAVELPIQVPAPIRPGEPSSAYINRLRVLDGAEAVGAVFVTGRSDGQRVVAPLTSDSATIRLPIVDTQKTGPTDITSGELVPWSIRLVNVGSVTATDIVATDVFGAEELPVVGAPTSLVPGEVVTAAASVSIPADSAREFTQNRVDVTWQDANGNVYGSTYDEVPANILRNAALRAELVDTLAADSDGNGFVSPGDTVRLTATLTNTGDVPVTEVVVTVPLDPNAEFVAGSLIGATLGATPVPDSLVADITDIAGGERAVISWDVRIVDPFPAGIAEVEAQGTISTNELDDVLTTDPSIGLFSPTITRVGVPFDVLEFEIVGSLLSDIDQNTVVSAGDVVRYEATIYNVGDTTSQAVTATIASDPTLAVVQSSLSSSAGTVTASGTDIMATGFTIAPGDRLVLTWDATLAPVLPVGQSEITVSGEVASSTTATVSDDPSTAVALDPTIITVGSSGIPAATGSAGSLNPGATAGPPGGGGPVNPGSGATCSAVTPTDGAAVASAVDVSATIEPTAPTTVASWKLVTYRTDDPTALVHQLGEGTGAPPAVLGTFDPTVRSNGLWTLLIEVVNSDGDIARCESSVAVEGQLKLGAYGITFQDLDVPVGSIPMQVRRTYNSLNRDQQGDFGYGWNLDIANFDVQTNTTLGLGPWKLESCGAGLIFVDLCWSSLAERYVNVTWPDGRVESFDLTPTGNSFWRIGAAIEYTPRAGTTSELTAVAGTTSGGLGGDGHLHTDFFGSGDIYNPQRFLLTDKNGTEYLLDRTTGLVSVEGRTGETLTISDAGIVSSLGRSIVFERDAAGRIERVTDPSGASHTYLYDANGDLVKYTDPVGSEITYNYLAGHYLEVVDDALPGQVQRATYDADGRLTSVTDGRGNTTALTNDVDNRTVTLLSPDGNTTTIRQFNESGDLVSENRIYDGENHVTSYEYDDDHRVIRTTDPLGGVTSSTYNADGNPTELVDGLGQTTTLTYSAEGEILSSTDAAGNTTTLTYGANGLPSSITDPTGRVTEFSFDGSGQLTELRDPATGTTTVEYSGSDITSLTLGTGARFGFDHDANGRVISTELPSGGVLSYQLDAAGRVVRQTDPNGNVTSVVRNAVGLVSQVIDAVGGTTSYEYDAVGNLTAVTDANGARRTTTYDSMNRVETEADALDRVTRYTYNPDGTVASVTDPRGVTVSSTYDALGRLVGRASPGESVSYAWDALGRMTQMIDDLGTTTYGYTPVGDLAVVDGPNGRVDYEYDAAGRQTAITTADGTREYSYDAGGNLSSLVDIDGGVFTFSYTPGGQLAQLQRPNLVTTDYAYDAVGQRTETTHSREGAVVSSTVSGYDLAGNRTSIVSDGVTQTYSFDQLNRVIGVIDSSGAASGSYAYDAVGNRIAADEGGVVTNYVYDAAGQLTSDSTGAVYSYDAAGNTLSDSEGSYTWDDFGRLASVSNGAGITQYRYSGHDQLMVLEGAMNHTLLWDESNQVSMLLSDGDTAYTPSPGGTLSSHRGGSPSYLLDTFLGTVGHTTAIDGSISGSRSYSTFGESLGAIGTPSLIGYTGEFNPAGIPLHLRARNYQPATGRFLSTDALQPNGPGTQGWNLYSYGLNNPSTFSDPLGYSVFSEYGALGLLGLALVSAVVALIAKVITCVVAFVLSNVQGDLVDLGSGQRPSDVEDCIRKDLGRQLLIAALAGAAGGFVGGGAVVGCLVGAGTAYLTTPSPSDDSEFIGLAFSGLFSCIAGIFAGGLFSG